MKAIAVTMLPYLVVMDHMSEGSHPGGRAMVLSLLILVMLARLVLHMAQGAGPGVLIINLLWKHFITN